MLLRQSLRLVCRSSSQVIDKVTPAYSNIVIQCPNPNLKVTCRPYLTDGAPTIGTEQDRSDPGFQVNQRLT